MSEFRHDIDPPPRLEGRVVEALTAHGLLKPSWRIRSIVFSAATAILLVALGYGAGWSHARNTAAPRVPGPQFMLLLHETPATLASTVPEQQRVEDYKRWARHLYESGNTIRGEKLKDVPGQTLGGFFIVQAPSLEAAQAIAKTCPHALLGGRIEIREIDPT